MRAPGGSIDEQQTGASGKEAGNSDGNEALQKQSQVVYNKKNGVEKPWLIRYNFHI